MMYRTAWNESGAQSNGEKVNCTGHPKKIARGKNHNDVRGMQKLQSEDFNTWLEKTAVGTSCGNPGRAEGDQSREKASTV